MFALIAPAAARWCCWSRPCAWAPAGSWTATLREAWLNAAVRTDLSAGRSAELLVAGRPRRPGPGPLTIKAVEPAAAEFWCDRGPRLLPCYRVRITGMREPCVALDPAIDLWWPHDHRENAATRTTATVDGATIHLPAWGGVQTDGVGVTVPEPGGRVTGFSDAASGGVSRVATATRDGATGDVTFTVVPA